MAFCPDCGAKLQDDKAFCPGCGKPLKPSGVPADGTSTPAYAAGPAAPPEPQMMASASSESISDNLAGLLAYLFVPAILFLVLDPYKKNKFIRFHSFQCLFFAAAWFVLWIILHIVGSVLWMIPVVGWMVVLVLFPLIHLLGLLLGIFLMIKAFKGEKFKLPVLGDLAEKQANAV